MTPSPSARLTAGFAVLLFSSLSVADATGARVDPGDAPVGPDDPKKLSVGLPALPPGRYTVRFRVLSVDGHVVESEFTFRLRPSR